jgi:hypothetical protein
MNIISETEEEIVLEKDKKGYYQSIPFKKVKEGEPWVKHVRLNGARFHVLSWVKVFGKSVEVRCSEPLCIYNKPYNEGDEK